MFTNILFLIVGIVLGIMIEKELKVNSKTKKSYLELILINIYNYCIKVYDHMKNVINKIKISITGKKENKNAG